MTDLAVTADGQPSFLATIFSMAVNIAPKSPFFVQKCTTEDEAKHQTFAPPVVKSTVRAIDRHSLTIKGAPPVSISELNHCAIERIINHIKDSYLKGQFDDAELEAYCDSRVSNAENQNFCFCTTYTFTHDGKDTLTVDFYISYTESVPAWGKYTRKGKFVPVTSMSRDEVNLIANAFMRQCTKALSSYTTLVYNHAATLKTAPNYYDALPK